MSSRHLIGRRSRLCCIRTCCLFYGIIALCCVIGHVLVLQHSVFFDDGLMLVVSRDNDEGDDVTTDRRHGGRDVGSSRVNISSVLMASPVTRIGRSSMTSQTSTTLDDLIFDDDSSSSRSITSDDRRASGGVRPSKDDSRTTKNGDDFVNLLRTSGVREPVIDKLPPRTDHHTHHHHHHHHHHQHHHHHHHHLHHHHHHHPSSYQFNCSNIGRINVKHKLGHGITKHVYLGLYRDLPAEAVPGGDDTQQRVAIKMVTRNVVDVVTCIRRQPAARPRSPSPSSPSPRGHRRRDDADRSGKSTVEEEDVRRRMCYIPPNMKLMKEILMHDQLRHPGLVPLLGYCARSEETESTSVADHGVVGVYAYAERFYASSLLSWSIERRLTAARQLADLLDFLERSPLGSLRIADFKESHFLLLADDDDVDGKRIVMTDLDDLTSVEPPCVDDTSPTQVNVDRPRDRKQCDYGVKCVGGECGGYNAKHNIVHMNRLYFSLLLDDPENACTDSQEQPADVEVTPNCGCVGRARVAEAMHELRRLLSNAELSANQLMRRLDELRRYFSDYCQ